MVVEKGARALESVMERFALDIADGLKRDKNLQTISNWFLLAIQLARETNIAAHVHAIQPQKLPAAR